MEANPEASGSGEGPSSSSPPAAGRATAAAASSSSSERPPPPPPPPSRYESQKRRDWNTFLQYLRNHKPPLSLSRCSGAHVIEFLKYLDQFGKTKIHVSGCAFFGHPSPPASCACPLRQAWGSLDALIGRLRAAYEENGGRPESNPFGARAVGIYLREVRTSQAKARGIPYEKKKRKRPVSAAQPPVDAAAAAGEVPTSAAAPAADTSGAVIPAESSAGARPPADADADAAKLPGATAAGSGSAAAADQPSAAPEAGSTSTS